MSDHYDDPVEVIAGSIRMSPDAMRALKKATGRSMGELLQDDDDEAAKFQVMGFAELHRRYARLGHLPDPAELWERAGSRRNCLHPRTPGPYERRALENLAIFCHYWRLTPDEVEALPHEVYRAFVRHMEREAYEIKRAAKSASKRRR